jgi:hypothetical protein
MLSKRKVTGGVLVVVGFMLSPLSWWNDAFVNLPLAYVFAWGVSACYKPAFNVAIVVGYWLTNVIGFVLLHRGGQQLFSEESRASTRRELRKDIVISLLYTALIVLLLKLGVLKPFENYFERR